MKRRSILTQWEIIDQGGWYLLRGAVMRDDRFPDGEVIRTSMLERIDFKKGTAETHNTIYKLIG